MSEAEAASAAETTEEAQAKGFFGEADPRDRSEYALTSGPESPTAAQVNAEQKAAEAQALLDQLEGGTVPQQATTPGGASTSKSSRSTKGEE
jgi:hypothetical protein